MQDTSGIANWDAISALTHKTEVRAEIGGSVYTGFDGERGIWEIKASSPLLTTLEIGKCMSAGLSLTLVNPGEIPRMAQIDLSVRLVHEDPTMTASDTRVSEWLPKGRFFVDTRETDSDGMLHLTAYDAMLKTEQSFTRPGAQGNWPRADAAIVTEIAQRIGVSVDARTSALLTENYQIGYPGIVLENGQPKYDQDGALSMREVLGYIGVMYGGNWILNAAGELRLVPLAGAFGASANFVPAEAFTLARNAVYSIYLPEFGYYHFTSGISGTFSPEDRDVTVSVSITDSHGEQSGMIWIAVDHGDGQEQWMGFLIPGLDGTALDTPFTIESESPVTDATIYPLGEAMRELNVSPMFEPITRVALLTGEKDDDGTEVAIESGAETVLSLTLPRGRMVGDANGDGEITDADIDYISGIISGTIPTPEGAEDFAACDAIADGTINYLDRVYLQQLVQGRSTFGERAEITGAWTQNPAHATDAAQFYVDLPGFIRHVEELDGDTWCKENIVRCEPHGGFVRVFVKKCPIASKPVVLTDHNPGRTLTARCPWATQTMADELFDRVGYLRYQPYSATDALLNPAAELGDLLRVGETVGMLATATTTFDALYTADIGAPQDEEIDHEYPYEPDSEREVRRTIAGANTTTAELRVDVDSISALVGNTSVASQIEATIGAITLSVTSSSAGSSISLTSGGVTVTSPSVNLAVDAANVMGLLTAATISADRITAGTINSATNTLYIKGLIGLKDGANNLAGYVGGRAIAGDSVAWISSANQGASASFWTIGGSDVVSVSGDELQISVDSIVSTSSSGALSVESEVELGGELILTENVHYFTGANAQEPRLGTPTRGRIIFIRA